MYTRIIFGLSFLFVSSSAIALTSSEKSPALIFEELFNRWTNSFNQKKLTESCQLFATSVIADYQGFPQKNYSAICAGFKKIFQEKNKQYQYHFKIHQIYQSDNLAAVRITWYLDVYENQKLFSSTQDEGLDILEKQPSGQWKIINYLAFPVAK